MAYALALHHSWMNPTAQFRTHPTMDARSTNDCVVARAVAAGDRDAFAVLVERHQRSLFALVYAIVGSREDTEDIVQEAFLRAYRAIDRYDSRQPFRPWLYSIARNTALNARKHNQRHVVSSLDAPDAKTPAGNEPGARERMQARALRRDLRDAVRRLPEKQATAFHLRYYEDLSVAEVAQVLDASQSDVKVTLHRARAALREMLSEYNP